MATLSRKGAGFIAHFEGIYTHAYNDPVGHCTIGVGHLLHHGPCTGREKPSSLTRGQAIELLRKDALGAAAAVDRHVTVPLTQAQYDALISFVFNVGEGAFAASTLLRRLNRGDYAAVPRELTRWTKAGSPPRPLPGLVRRRTAEGELFSGGDYAPGPAASYLDDRNGRVPNGGPPVSVADVQQALGALGWPLKVDDVAGPKTREAIGDFQRGYAPRVLPCTGVCSDDRTVKALHRAAGDGGHCSPHFCFSEFKSKGNGWIKLQRALVRALEAYRREIGRPVPVLSGYRDPAHNRAVGGKPLSQHLFGTAADIPGVLSVDELRALRLFSGLGYNASTGRVVHVDVRHAGPNNPTGGSPASPTTWVYAR